MFKILAAQNIGFGSVSDFVQTEQNVYNLMIQNNGILPDDFGYVGIPLADNINKRGLTYTQNIINDVQNKYPDVVKKFVCQHIHAPLLNFYNNVVFTPHSTANDSNRCIPHYNNLIKRHDFIEIEKRQFFFSFFGAYSSHSIRKDLESFNSNDTPVVDTGAWHYYKDEKTRNEQENSYVFNLKNTVFNLCPQGTGSSTIRLYEAMACGSIPVLFNDVKVPDCVEHLCLRTCIQNLRKDISLFSDVERKCREIHEIYWKQLSNDVILDYILNNV